MSFAALYPSYGLKSTASELPTGFGAPEGSNAIDRRHSPREMNPKALS